MLQERSSRVKVVECSMYLAGLWIVEYMVGPGLKLFVPQISHEGGGGARHGKPSRTVAIGHLHEKGNCS